MAKRFNLVREVISRNVRARETDVLIGHPCGYIASASWLRKHPKVSRKVSDFLLGDASFSGDFELMLVTMALCKCELSRDAWRHLKHWKSRGCPHWKNDPAFSALLVSWWNKSAWVFVPGRNTREPEAVDAAEYYRDIVFSLLEEIEKAAIDNRSAVTAF
jgi:hypothetical protein